jgi:hypothetical protein
LLVSIPRLSTQSEEEVHARVRWFDYGAVMIILTLLAIGNVYAFYKR